MAVYGVVYMGSEEIHQSNPSAGTEIEGSMNGGPIPSFTFLHAYKSRIIVDSAHR